MRNSAKHKIGTRCGRLPASLAVLRHTARARDCGIAAGVVMRVIFPSVWVLLAVFSPRACPEIGPSDPPELESGADGEYRLGPPFLQLPVFLHSRVPLLDMAELSPARAPGLDRLPQRVREVLVPIPELSQRGGIESGPSRLRVACSSKQMRVKVSREMPGSGGALRLGTCAASWSTEQHLYFRYELHQCGTRTQIINNRVVFSNTLHYTPDETQGSTGSSSAFSIPVQCHFNRFHYSYKIGYVPQVQTQRLFKPIKPQGGIRLTSHDAQWNRLDPAEGYVIGHPMYFEAEVGSVSEGERLFVQSCHVTVNSSHISTPRITIIDNYGCMIDSKSTVGSRFIKSSRRNAVRFSIDAFVLKGKQAKHLYMHCELSVSSENPTETSKFCSYNRTTDRWEELYGDDAVCSCCNATCLPGAPPAAAGGDTSGPRLMVVDEYIRGRESVEILVDPNKAEPPPTAPRTKGEEPRRMFEKVFGLD
ncbi:zona pellucida sperm-binding protein 3d.2 isoform X1 [Astyanax mexicanus]|uniref:zona pellucida sperm-binding protein 3d.2 isoform X1 n=1 Tax=Astyanax mexicanus TaxID=7994 RepID=UPI0020CB11C2|nr:zona pellucida sperm-binding protein 3d.2 isoform X1 [Astyanax mexicanus]